MSAELLAAARAIALAIYLGSGRGGVEPLDANAIVNIKKPEIEVVVDGRRYRLTVERS